MKIVLIINLLFLITISYAVPGDTIRTVSFGYYRVMGLAYDSKDRGIWISASQDYNIVLFCKYDNSLDTKLRNWIQLKDAYHCSDITYPYFYNGNDCLAIVDEKSPIIKIYNPNDGSFLGSIPDPPITGPTVGIAVGEDETIIFISNFNRNYLQRWNGASWTNFGTTLSKACGVSYAWNHIFIIHQPEVKKLRVLKKNGSFMRDIPLNNWGSYYMIGLCRGRDNIVGKNESLYTAIIYPANYIREIEIGDLNTDIETTSLGDIKALFH
ncbi:MAG: hypothetical protein ACUVWP_05615 [bacterium]